MQLYVISATYVNFDVHRKVFVSTVFGGNGGEQPHQICTRFLHTALQGICKKMYDCPHGFSCWWKDYRALLGTYEVAAQAQLARCMAWLDPIDDGEMVRQSVANWTEAKVRANMWDQYRMKGSFHGRAANHWQDRDCDCDCEHGWNQGSWHDSLSMALVKLS